MRKRTVRVSTTKSEQHMLRKTKARAGKNTRRTINELDLACDKEKEHGKEQY